MTNKKILSNVFSTENFSFCGYYFRELANFFVGINFFANFAKIGTSITFIRQLKRAEADLKVRQTTA